MAIARLSVKVGKVGKAMPHASYISRTDAYAKRLDTGEKLEAIGHGNMPDWAAHNPLMFWRQADQNERKNGATYREHEIALPRELNPSQRLDLLHDWIEQEIGDKHAYQYAIHNPKSLDGGENPHVHLMFSERSLDGIDRDPQQFFKRYNSKYPERGGCRKANFASTRSQRAIDLKEQRDRWEKLTNKHLERAGIAERINMRSYKNQGLELQPEPKMLPSEWRNPAKRAEIVEFREAQKELLAARKELNSLVPKMRKALCANKRKINARLSPEKIKKIREQHHNKMVVEYEKYAADWRQKAYGTGLEIAKLKEKQRRYPKEPDQDNYRNWVGYITDKKLKAYQDDWMSWNKGKKEMAERVEKLNRIQKETPSAPQGFEYFSKTRFEKDHPDVVKEEKRIFENQQKEKARVKKPVLNMKELMKEKQRQRTIDRIKSKVKERDLGR